MLIRPAVRFAPLLEPDFIRRLAITRIRTAAITMAYSSKVPSWRREPLESSDPGADRPMMPRPSPYLTSPATAAIANQRLSSISRHLSSTPSFEINTPFSTERHSVLEEDFDLPVPNHQPAQQPEQHNAKMSSQPPHPAVMIPGPIEYDDEVLKSMSHFSQGHVGQPFVNCFGEVLTMFRSLLQTENPNSQPFIISGSGTLGWDQIASNLAEPGDNVLLLHTGYFADSFADCFQVYGANPTQIKAPIGGRPQLPEIEAALKQKKYKLLTVTHVDTSTGVLSELEKLTQMVRRVSPETLVIVDGVCSVGAEPIYFDKWDLDVVMTASQKAIGCPAGLSLLMASERAMNVFKKRSVPPNSYFASWKNWTQIMQNYEAKKPSYFATPSPQLIHALHTALSQILAKPLEERFRKHHEVSQRIKKKVESLGLKQLAQEPADQANAMTAVWLPEGTLASDFLPGVLQKGVVLAGGLHKEVATKYIRFGHMGVSVMDDRTDHIEKALKAIEERLAEIKSS